MTVPTRPAYFVRVGAVQQVHQALDLNRVRGVFEGGQQSITSSSLHMMLRGHTLCTVHDSAISIIAKSDRGYFKSARLMLARPRRSGLLLVATLLGRHRVAFCGTRHKVHCRTATSHARGAAKMRRDIALRLNGGHRALYLGKVRLEATEGVSVRECSRAPARVGSFVNADDSKPVSSLGCAHCQSVFCIYFNLSDSCSDGEDCFCCALVTDGFLANSGQHIDQSLPAPVGWLMRYGIPPHCVLMELPVMRIV
eukprot:6000720-Pleurochrysis_carterae.AAC.2